MATTHVRTCPLCEATCGLELTVDAGSVTRIRGDREDVFSRGFMCPKGTALKHLHEDPDRLRAPMVREGDAWHEATWEEAFAVVERGITGVLERGGRDALALYIGNPVVHSLSASVLTPALVKALGSKNFYSAASVDQMPKHLSSGLMFGSATTIAVPDIDRTQYLVIVGANPWVSNGSLATAPDFPGRLEQIRRRGGRVVVVDPRRTKTAAEADEHIFIRPGTDALFLAAIANTLFAESLVSLGSIADHVSGVDEVARSVEPFTPKAVADATGIAPDTTRRIARELAAAPSGSVYDRVGAHQQSFGTLASWLSDVITALTGNLDRPGGKLFPLAAHAQPDPSSPRGRGFRTGRFHSRVRGVPEVFGQLPAAALAEEIEAPGEGQIRGLVTVAGNPVLSTPNGKRLARALETLDFMVSVDPWLNETTRHAHVILPPPSVLARHHYDFAFYPLAVRHIANYSPPLFEPEGPDEWEILSRIALVAAGQPVTADPAIVPQMILGTLLQSAVAPGGSLEGRDADEIVRALGDRDPVLRILDFRLRSGPYGDRFGENPDGLSLDVLVGHPHGVDLGPLVPRIPNVLKTASGKVELAPELITADVARLRASLDEERPELMLIGRRHLRSNNSWMHNVATLQGGTNRCTLLMHPADADRLGLADGKPARVRSRVGELDVTVEVSDEMMAGVVSLPHGWGHNAAGARLSIAQANPGVSSNDLSDEASIDPLSGNAVLNAIPVGVEPIYPR